MATNYNASRHIVVEKNSSEFVRWLGEEFPLEGLFVYLHRFTGNFVVSVWMSRPCGEFDEIHILGPSITNPVRSVIEELRRKLHRPTNSLKLADHLSMQEYQELRKATDDSKIHGGRYFTPRKLQVVNPGGDLHRSKPGGRIVASRSPIPSS